ncbi:mannitol dehydrogenase family protein [Schleiferilactobacillus perolens]|uniref:mannitol dehydrogenase family protein n=1 Tax=Schleiferilactobacillus perolens TaxID=100468 RepID=UPI0023558A2B|nr:mannitol dehydrogenase family protein [Schleiferilactobacillus perolens]MCI2171955.1 mannitol dehydrogenase family protein [Schleiferilactobacillus perolens]
MVKLTDDYQHDAQVFQDAGINVPKYDQAAMKAATDAQPVWVHMGGGNLFRCFHARIAQELLNSGDLTSGIIVAETYDDDVPAKIYQPYNNRALQVVLAPDGGMDQILIASIAHAIYYQRDSAFGWTLMKKIFEQPSLQLVTMTITEKGYTLKDLSGELTAAAQADIANGPETAQTNMGAIARLLLARYQSGALPIAMVSTDNFSENGQHFADGILTIARGWVANGHAPQGFVDYLSDPAQVSFPWSMIDRITPNPAETVAARLEKEGFTDTDIIHTPKHTNIAPFGNTEETHYLVIEDSFPNGRPPLEKAGVIMTDRNTVNDADQMKVTACLNPLHTALGIFGSMLGYTSVADEMDNPDLVALIKRLGYQEDLPVVKDPKIINPRDFLDTFINKRLPNRYIPDTPQRLVTDASQMLSIRYGVTIQHYLDRGPALVSQLVAIPFILAGWCRYLMGVDDHGEAFTLSPDPLQADLHKQMAAVKLGETSNVHTVLQPILSNPQLFGHDLYAIGLGDTVEKDFQQLIAGPGAVTQALHALNH